MSKHSTFSLLLVFLLAGILFGVILSEIYDILVLMGLIALVIIITVGFILYDNAKREIKES